jgi:gamma-glutamylcyclotransferase (GGCT)/AIG2-like uncharacterized protein YtfP
MTAEAERSVPLFSYGTLRQANVQRATFGRLLEGREDSLPGYALAPLAIDEPEVVATSGLAVHTMAVATGDPADCISGIVFRITPAELEAADRYEVAAMKRISVTLVSGAEAFVYVSAGS